MGERCKLHQRGPGRSPGRNRIWYTLELLESHCYQSFWVFWSACLTADRSQFSTRPQLRGCFDTPSPLPCLRPCCRIGKNCTKRLNTSRVPNTYQFFFIADFEANTKASHCRPCHDYHGVSETIQSHSRLIYGPIQSDNELYHSNITSE